MPQPEILRYATFLHSEQALPRRPRAHTVPIHGAARLARAEDLSLLLRLADPGTRTTPIASFSPLLEGPDGALAPAYEETLHLSEELRSRHLLAVGITGSGKTTRVLQKLLAADIRDRRRSLVVLDVKVEMYSWLQRLTRKHRRRDVKVVNFGDAERSLGWNPLRPGLTRSEAYEIAFAICHAAEVRGDSRDSIYFVNNSIRLLTGIFLALTAAGESDASFARVQELLDQAPQELAAWLKRHAAASPLLASFASFIGSGNTNAETVVTDLAMRLSSFLDEDLRRTTSLDQFRFEQLVDQPEVILVEIGEAKIEKLRPTLNLFFTRALDELIQRAEREPGCRLPRPVALHFDEFASSIGRIPQIEKRLSTARSRNIQVVASIQSLAQLEHVYGSAAPIVTAGFGSKIFLPGLERIDAEYASRIAGTMTAQAVSLEEIDFAGAESGTKRTTSGVARALLLPEEIASPPEHFELGRPSTWFLAGLPPFQAWVRPAYEEPELAAIFRKGRVLRPKPGAKTFAPRVDVPSCSAASPETRLEKLKQKLGWESTTGSAREWWSALERENAAKPGALLRLSEELAQRDATLSEFYLAYVYSQTEDMQAVLHYLDYRRVKSKADAAKRASKPSGSR